ncbi:hypothetical protein DITRI_Ditri06bG0089400 [Diplodiscus trichospermus]
MRTKTFTESEIGWGPYAYFDALLEESSNSNRDTAAHGIEQMPNASKHTEEHGNIDASSSQKKLEATKFEPGTKYPFIKQASHVLDGFPTPLAFAFEFP